jgi:hypothetical protein
VHVAPEPTPLIVKTAGAPSLAAFGDASGCPLVQVTEMLTEDSSSSGSKSFVTVKVTDAGVSRVLVIVHAVGLPLAIATSRHPRSLLA